MGSRSSVSHWRNAGKREQWEGAPGRTTGTSRAEERGQAVRLGFLAGKSYAGLPEGASTHTAQAAGRTWHPGPLCSASLREEVGTQRGLGGGWGSGARSKGLLSESSICLHPTPLSDPTLPPLLASQTL